MVFDSRGLYLIAGGNICLQGIIFVCRGPQRWLLGCSRRQVSYWSGPVKGEYHSRYIQPSNQTLLLQQFTLRIQVCHYFNKVHVNINQESFYHVIKIIENLRKGKTDKADNLRWGRVHLQWWPVHQHWAEVVHNHFAINKEQRSFVNSYSFCNQYRRKVFCQFRFL